VVFNNFQFLTITAIYISKACLYKSTITKSKRIPLAESRSAAALRSQINLATARQVLDKQLNTLEHEVLKLREKTAVAQRLSDEKTLSLSKLERRFYPSWQPAKIVRVSGEVTSIPVLDIGPVTWCWDAAEHCAGLASVHDGAQNPTAPRLVAAQWATARRCHRCRDASVIYSCPRLVGLGGEYTEALKDNDYHLHLMTEAVILLFH
jgi:hypothetical protein